MLHIFVLCFSTMNIKFILIALVFFLIPEASEGLLLDNFKITTSYITTENCDYGWLEELEAEIVSAHSEYKTVESGSSSGGVTAAFAKAEKNLIFQYYYRLTSINIESWLFIPKNPKYIQYCSLKLHC